MEVFCRKTWDELVIRIREQPEPDSFNEKVRRKGNAFLKKSKRPFNWEGHSYWRTILPELHSVYKGICSYSAEWIPFNATSTVDHFIPKDQNPDHAYEWKNYRLAFLKFNARKKDFTDVLDPFTLVKDCFVLNFPSHLIIPNPNLPDNLKKKADKTIKRLKLNDDDLCVQSRLRWTNEFCDGVPFDFLKRNAPFIAYELQRQKLVDKIAEIMKT